MKRVILLEDYYFWTRTKNEREYVDSTLTDSVQRLEVVHTSSSEATKNEIEYGKGSDKETR